MPCGGAVRRDLLEMELAALRRDRVSIKEKLLQVLLFDPHMNFEGEMSSYSADHGPDRLEVGSDRGTRHPPLSA